ncbi:hypothetical protein M3B15_08600 [Corynebacterium sanguinis]|uniref:hypothetical protein n=1 Tax=Corynebacterium sanguinis TaxID=2594913 RepID=UPI00223B277A|nr:hypothetical protein [Corynebacterium sanguinis]MCT1664635.1 hypothetical protein [Corynebacterium sanguinis]
MLSRVTCATTVLEGEFAAVHMLLEQVRHSPDAIELDIITDSLTVARVMNSDARRPFALNYERRAMAELDKVRARGDGSGQLGARPRWQPAQRARRSRRGGRPPLQAMGAAAGSD